MEGSAGHFTTIVVWGGFALAFVFGLIANKTNFCTMGALSDIVNMGHWGRMRMWLLAIAVAILGSSLLAYFGQIDLAKAVARRHCSTPDRSTCPRPRCSDRRWPGCRCWSAASPSASA